jgi:hypothetical protein
MLKKQLLSFPRKRESLWIIQKQMPDDGSGQDMTECGNEMPDDGSGQDMTECGNEMPASAGMTVWWQV